MLEYTEKLTLTPAMITEDDINALRAAGWDDTDVLDIVMACAYFNFRVRVVDGLGLETPDTSATNAARAREHAASWRGEGRLPPQRHLGRPRAGGSGQHGRVDRPLHRHTGGSRYPEGRGEGAVCPEALEGEKRGCGATPYPRSCLRPNGATITSTIAEPEHRGRTSPCHGSK